MRHGTRTGARLPVAYLAVVAVVLQIAFASLHIVGMVRAALAGTPASGFQVVLCLPSGGGTDLPVDDRGDGSRLAGLCPYCATTSGGAPLLPGEAGLARPAFAIAQSDHVVGRDAAAITLHERLVKRSRAPPRAAA